MSNMKAPLPQCAAMVRVQNILSGKWNSSGCIFLDSQNTPDFSDRHSIIYGHHMKNGTMFSGLTEDKKQEFYDGLTEKKAVLV